MSQQIVAADLTEPPQKLPKFTPGRIYIAEDGKVWQYAKLSGVPATSDYLFLTKDGVYTASQLTSTNVANGKVQQIGNYTNVNTAVTGYYTWIFRGFGAHKGSFLASCVQDVRVGPSATAGAVDDAATQSAIVGLSLLATIVGAAISAAWANGIMYTDGSVTA